MAYHQHRSAQLGHEFNSLSFGISQPSWSRIERGETALSIEQLAKAASLFGVSPAQILKQADDYVSALGSIDVTVEPERPDRTSSAALAIIGGAVLAFLIAKALSK
jgi:transcriptional regulator with XRE-family HTH domain